MVPLSQVLLALQSGDDHLGQISCSVSLSSDDIFTLADTSVEVVVVTNSVVSVKFSKALTGKINVVEVCGQSIFRLKLSGRKAVAELREFIGSIQSALL